MTKTPVHDPHDKPAGLKPRGCAAVSQSELARIFRAGKQEGVKFEVIYPGFRVVMNEGVDKDVNRGVRRG